MSSLVLTTAQKQAIRQAPSPETACHLVYHATDDAFYFGDADDITGRIRDAQLEDDFDALVYDKVEKEFFALHHEDSTRFRTQLHRYILSHLED